MTITVSCNHTLKTLFFRFMVYVQALWILYLLQVAVVLRLHCDLHQLFLVFLNLFLETHILLTDHSLQLPQLIAKP